MKSDKDNDLLRRTILGCVRLREIGNIRFIGKSRDASRALVQCVSRFHGITPSTKKEDTMK